MKNSNKIIPFNKKIRQKSEFRLKAEISIYICRNEEQYIFDCTSPDTDITIEEIMDILNKILDKISSEISKIEYKEKDSYTINLSLYYYEDINNKANFKYLCLPRDVKLEKLAEYLYCFICLYNYKNTDEA